MFVDYLSLDDLNKNNKKQIEDEKMKKRFNKKKKKEITDLIRSKQKSSKTNQNTRNTLDKFFGKKKSVIKDESIIKDKKNKKDEKLKKYQTIPLIISNYNALISLERTFGQKIPYNSKKGRNKLFSFNAENGYITELRLTKFSLKNFIKVKDLPEELGLLESLKFFEIQLTDISCLPKSFESLKSLEKIILSHNKVNYLHESFGLLKSLKYLDLNHNNLSNIPESFTQLSCLEFFDLSNNKISKFPSSFYKLHKLKTLDLSNNKIEELPFNFQDLKSLERVDLHNNLISPENWSKIKFPSSLKEIYLSNNPICFSKKPELIEPLQDNCWIFLTHPISAHYLKGNIHFCPKHGKHLNIKKHWVNKFKGWLEYRFECPVEGCSYFESVPPSYHPKAKDIMLEKKFKKENVMIYEEEQCPPHEIVAVELGKRLVFKCRKCQKSEEEI